VPSGPPSDPAEASGVSGPVPTAPPADEQAADTNTEAPDLDARSEATDARRLTTRLPALDGIRGVFMVTVALFHAGHLSGAFFSVDIFFVLSGYLITLLLLDEHVTKRRIGLKRFWGRRVRRLAPAMIVTLTGSLLLIALVFGINALQFHLRQALLALVSASNFYEMESPTTIVTPYQHTWSLAVEEQFYLVWPLVVAGVLLIMRRSGRGSSASCAKALMVVAVAGAALSQWLMMSLHHGAKTVPRVYYSTDTRMAPILLGAALACLTTAYGFVRGWGRVLLEGAALLGVVAIIWSFIFVTRSANSTFEGGYVAFILIATIFVAAAAHPERGPIARFLSFRPFVWFGLISYGVYLWHWPLFFLLNESNTGLGEWPLLAVQMTLTTIIAALSFLFIEQPIRRHRRPFVGTGVPAAVRRAWSSIMSSPRQPDDEPGPSADDGAVTALVSR
jgi:peptidoglycan/LPS O-acetylase OafA/YrhL